MLHSKDLYHLIHTLTKSEKRYFMIFAGRHVIGAGNKYVVLFKLIDGMRVYSEDALRQRAHKVGIANHLSTTKNYLYGLILASMRAFETDRNIGIRLREELHNADILLAKCLSDQCERTLKKARLLATRHENFTALLDILRKERETISSQTDVDLNVKQIFDEERKAISRGAKTLRSN